MRNFIKKVELILEEEQNRRKTRYTPNEVSKILTEHAQDLFCAINSRIICAPVAEIRIGGEELEKLSDV